MEASTVPTSTAAPTSPAIAATRPVAGDGPSVSTLSVEISTIASSASTQSPTRLRHSTIVPSATDTPICGMFTSTVVVLVREELTASLLHVVHLREHDPLERRAERARNVRRGHAHHGTIEVLERLLRDQGTHLGAHATGAVGLVEHHHLARLAHRCEDRLGVERDERAEVDHLHRRAVDVVGRLQRDAHHRAVRDRREVCALARHARMPERRLVAPLGYLTLHAPVEVL